MPLNRNSNSRKLHNFKTKVLYSFAIVAVLLAAFPWLYEIKTKAGINISKSRHAGTFFEQKSGGLFKCEWLYPYHCEERPKVN
ncbi:conserved hypothetical protein [Trichormus variabilis ATCC 29413]|uniref:Uncharacterized protein n=2 Tax=Anabaena variabilis TaxID=264691 RepID=Q3M4C8_TRIV2|nr:MULTISPECIES: hypothetical protein [Nostocaceae]ABA24158.1 conserved hypothetical protein [Trichormus variabilis ATCC 29413]MBC1215413.1 hypothetical protein [Trichormus variabilis ARAD]MBC1254997.1 hypothetical protein [Trichormus variabilis V5]MBC1266243.1 hypothetical protein [Trichormus variabilis FSR]MBC1301982.1 hypothetical protein [Trichormus variabilis N2B]